MTSTPLTCPPLLRDGDLWHSLQHAGCIQVPSLPPSAIDQAVVINQATANYSPANLRDTVRPAVSVGVVSAPARLRFYYRDRQCNDQRVEMFEPSDDFFLRFDFLLSGRTHQGPDDLSPEAWLDHDDTPLRSEQLADFLGAPSLPAHHRKADSP